MGFESWASIAMLGLILSVLAAVYVRCGKTWRLLSYWHVTTQARQKRVNRHAEENRELRSALRAEKAHVEQLQRKVEILQALLPVV
ncbi:hypothetical protein AEQ67_13145 [Pseudomonas sp. RIT-PI-q]|uniref:hypothetical protein n=1 Tax=Pseudomonas sp. RIT-PI-q TaxID=1690247 RepID=UPI0006CD9CE4|nr:hypothetical protein [Pseudomonas sp. RIT-PI-q]KPG98298.1 hypothetical protein AEQ67_13145 [Pseudomonas sp. RIT-PI-q]